MRINTHQCLVAVVTAYLGLVAVGGSLFAQDTLHSNDFENASMGPWSASGSDAGLYHNGDVVSNMGASDALINYAPNGEYCLWDGRGGSYLVLTDPLPLASRAYTSVTISFNWVCRNSSGTRRLYTRYSPDNGATWVELGYLTGPTAAFSSGSKTYTITSTGQTFSDQAKFRFDFTDSGGSAGPFFVDDIVITATPEFSGAYWDLNGTAAGAGSDSPSGTWDAANLYWNDTPDGTGATNAWTAGITAVFSAGTDATNSYTVTVDGTQEIGGLTFEDGTVTLSGGGLQMSSDSPVFVPADQTATIATPFSEDATPRKLSKTGSGTLVLSGDNSAATGGMSLNNGITQFESTDAINGTTRNVAVNAGGVAAFGASFGTGNIQTALDERIVAASTGTIAADNYAATDFDFGTPGLTAYLGAVGNVTYTGTLTPEGTTYRLGGGGGTLTHADAVTGGNALIVNGNVVLTSANDYTGATTINAGTLTKDAASAFGNDAAVTMAVGTTLDITGFNTGVGSLSGYGEVLFAGAALTFGSDNTDRTYYGNLTGAGGSITKVGTKRQELRAGISFDGDTTISGGTLRIGYDNTTYLGTQVYAGTISFSNGATLDIWSDADQTLSGNISGDGNISKAYGHTLTLTGNNTYTGKTSISPNTTEGSTLSVTSFNSVNGGTPLLASSSLGCPTTVDNGTITIGNGGKRANCNLYYTGPGETTDRVIKLQFNDYSAQSIYASGTGLLKFTSAFISNAGGQTGYLGLNGTGSGEIVEPLTVLPTGTKNGYALRKSGTGTWTIHGQNSYASGTRVDGGILVLADGECLPDATSLIIVSPGKVQLNAGVQEKVASLTLGSTPQDPGVYGSTSSSAPPANQSDTYFSGTGLLYVGVDIPSGGTVIILR